MLTVPGLGCGSGHWCMVGGSMAVARASALGEVQSCWLGTSVGIATAVQVV